MKRFAANYLLRESGTLLKNGILETADSGKIFRIWDTKGDLRESGQLSFQNGILIFGFQFLKLSSAISADADIPFLKLFPENDQVNLQQLIETGKIFQEHFPEKTIRQFFSDTDKFLIQSGNYRRITLPGVFLLTGCDLVNMKFTSKSRLKKLL